MDDQGEQIRTLQQEIASLQAQLANAQGQITELKQSHALLEAIVERDRAFRDDAARKTLLALFEALGDDPLVANGRRRLATVLF